MISLCPTERRCCGKGPVWVGLCCQSRPVTISHFIVRSIQSWADRGSWALFIYSDLCLMSLRYSGFTTGVATTGRITPWVWVELFHYSSYVALNLWNTADFSGWQCLTCRRLKVSFCIRLLEKLALTLVRLAPARTVGEPPLPASPFPCRTVPQWAAGFLHWRRPAFGRGLHFYFLLYGFILGLFSCRFKILWQWLNSLSAEIPAMLK